MFPLKTYPRSPAPLSASRTKRGCHKYPRGAPSSTVLPSFFSRGNRNNGIPHFYFLRENWISPEFHFHEAMPAKTGLSVFRSLAKSRKRDFLIGCRVCIPTRCTRCVLGALGAYSVHSARTLCTRCVLGALSAYSVQARARCTRRVLGA